MATFKAVASQTGKYIKLDGISSIKIRVYRSRESQYIFTAYYIRPESMDESGRILSGVTNGEMIEHEANAYIQKIRRGHLKLGQDGTQFMPCMDLKEEIEKSPTLNAEFIDFIGFAQNIVAQTEKEKTIEWCSSPIDILCWYTKRKKVDVKLITSSLLNKMIKDLYQSGPAGVPLRPGTISHYLRGLRALYNKVELYHSNEGLDIIRILGDSFKKAEIPEYQRKRKNIDINTLLRIRNFQSDKRRTNTARDAFMMMFYMMGTNVNDLYSILYERRRRLGYTRLRTSTGKDREQVPPFVKTEPELRTFLDRYTEGYFLSYFHTSYCSLNNFTHAINSGLRDICLNLEIGFGVTTNWACHSWASLARNKAGAPKANIDFCPNHMNNDYKMADIYINIDYGIRDKANHAALDLLREKGGKKD